MSAADTPIRLLAFAEGATLAHVVRPLALTEALDPGQFSVTFACPRPFRWTLGNYPWPVVDLDCQDAAIFAQRLARVQPMYSRATLEQYVADDLRLMECHRPQIVVGDFRLSLAISARLYGVPYLALSNAYWDPSYSGPLPLPSLPGLSLLPNELASRLFRSSFALGEHWHSWAFKQLLKSRGMPSIHGIRAIYTEADAVAYCDLPALFSDGVVSLPAGRTIIGAVPWSPPLPLPAWWQTLEPKQPLIYVTLGSSGDKKCLAEIVDGLSSLADPEYAVVVATAGAELGAVRNRPNVYCADYLPGRELCERARLVVCNGGSPTTQQALIAGKPVLGIPYNLDQHLSMQRIERAGVGLGVRADRTSSSAIRQAAATLLSNELFTRRARQVGTFSPPASERFGQLLTALAPRSLRVKQG